MHFFWQSMLKDLRRQFQDWVSLLIYMAIPILIGTVIAIATGGSGGVKPVAVLLLSDEDNTFASNLVSGAFTQGELAEIIRVEEVTTADGEARIEAGEGSAFLVIPEGFSSALLKEEPLELHLITNPAQQILPGILEETLNVMVDGTFYIHRILGDELRQITGMAEGDVSPTDSDISAISVEINQTMSQLGDYLSPLAIELTAEVEEEPTDGPKISIGVLFLPGILVMALLLIAGGASEDIWKEKEGGTLRRVNTAPPGVLPLLAGKLAAAACLMGVVSFVGLILGTYVYDIPHSGFIPALLWAVFTGVTLFLMALTLQVFASSHRTGSVLTSLVIFPLMMLGGSFFPSESMPGWMASIGAWTPNGIGVEQIKDFLLDRANLESLAVSGAILGVFSIVLLTISVWRINRAFVTH